jgi:hypothetical protein
MKYGSPTAQNASDEVDGSRALEDPIGTRGQNEEDPEEHLEDLERHLHRRVEQGACLRHLAQALVDRREDVVFQPL